MEPPLTLQDCMEVLSNDFRDFHNIKEVEVVDGAPTAVEFLRKWLSSNIPVIFKNAINHWPALSKWDHFYLRNVLKDQNLTVSLTPNGYADAVLDDLFVLPKEKVMTISEFLDNIQFPQEDKIYYIQKQNNNLFDEFSCLAEDVDFDIQWATEALGRTPDAVNFWMGDNRAVTSMHKDHYENIYCVVEGHKEFILHPPTDLPWIPYRFNKTCSHSSDDYECAVYSEANDRKLELKLKGNKIPWISIDPLKPDYEKYPLYRKANPIHCIVEKGDVLYLPSLWFHHVQQSNGCIAVNYWYDMNFDVKYCYYKFLENIANHSHTCTSLLK